MRIFFHTSHHYCYSSCFLHELWQLLSVVTGQSWKLWSQTYLKQTSLLSKIKSQHRRKWLKHQINFKTNSWAVFWPQYSSNHPVNTLFHQTAMTNYPWETFSHTSKSNRTWWGYKTRTQTSAGNQGVKGVHAIASEMKCLRVRTDWAELLGRKVRRKRKAGEMAEKMTEEDHGGPWEEEGSRCAERQKLTSQSQRLGFFFPFL